MDKHFAIVLLTLNQATKAIQENSKISDVSLDGTKDSAEILFSVESDGEKKHYSLKLEELVDAKCKRCGSWLNNYNFCKDVTCPYSDLDQDEEKLFPI